MLVCVCVCGLFSRHRTCRSWVALSSMPVFVHDTEPCRKEVCMRVCVSAPYTADRKKVI